MSFRPTSFGLFKFSSCLFIKKLGDKASQGELTGMQDRSINYKNMTIFDRSIDAGCENKV